MIIISADSGADGGSVLELGRFDPRIRRTSPADGFQGKYQK